jgi:hypothetical protein
MNGRSWYTNDLEPHRRGVLADAAGEHQVSTVIRRSRS